ncbi:hypothetical protein [Caballeronia novacaledonica]|uniref:Uncharacterized protein n=1 Tax=Caballeronia novacaledonica TaxID=1544861 RepID=A0AA37IL61_9BURK|nr:hypothetical protein [Caballeronia novacaledonica]GJH30699.1 hypothetical protein CBA19CS42_39305 [Caballeronia novacaledonica]
MGTIPDAATDFGTFEPFPAACAVKRIASVVVPDSNIALPVQLLKMKISARAEGAAFGAFRLVVPCSLTVTCTETLVQPSG